MKKYVLITLAVWGLLGAPLYAESKIKKTASGEYVLSNEYLARNLSIKGKVLTTRSIHNKISGVLITPTTCDEFKLRVSAGTDKEGTDKILTNRDFKMVNVSEGTLENGARLIFKLENKELLLEVRYDLKDDESFMRKSLTIKSKKPLCLERVDLESMSMDDIYQPYTVKAYRSRGKWSPGFGQPLYTSKSATFWGVEFPASRNEVKGKHMTCSYMHGFDIQNGHTSFDAVMGVGSDSKYIVDTFQEYINKIRVRPLRLQVQFNSWFDSHTKVTPAGFRASVKSIHKELVTKRGNRPLSAYVIDDGWQDSTKDSDWSDKVWKVNEKFDPDFAFSHKTVKNADSSLGLWLSPQCNFNARFIVPKLREQGFEVLDDWLSLAGPKYMGMFEERLVELTKQGVTFFKLDGTFGHQFIREFDLNGADYGVPSMPQLGVAEIKASDRKLGEAKYDEAKDYYMTLGTQRLMQVFDKMAEVNPEVYIIISNGAYLSPWWLMHCDSVWMINAGDAAGGSDRKGELVYRDGVYYEIFEKENTQFPICSIFNHEPKKTKTGESQEVFRNYLYMNMSRGTGFIELYIIPGRLKSQDWDVLSEGLHWAYDVFPVFSRARMHGGNPKNDEVYGYTGWSHEQGYISIHNPSEEEQRYRFTLDRDFGLIEKSGNFHLSSPLSGSLAGLKSTYGFGDTLELFLEPGEIRILNFDKKIKTWEIQKDLQAVKKQKYTSRAR